MVREAKNQRIQSEQTLRNLGDTKKHRGHAHMENPAEERLMGGMSI